jgi:hypothetical protein
MPLASKLPFPLRATTAFVLLAASTTASAQKMYRCGNTFSQTPCASDARTVEVRKDSLATPPPGLRGQDLCRTDAAQQLRLPDPASTQIVSVVKQDAEALQVAGSPVFARKYTVVLNAKNTQGAYQGDTAYSCYLNETETRIIKFEIQGGASPAVPASPATPPPPPPRR